MSFLFRYHNHSLPSYVEQKNHIKSRHFCLKVLTAMYELQSGNSAYINGIRSKDIMRYMQEKFDLDGDVKTQVHISLQQSLAYGFITKEFGKYKMVGPMAKVIQEPHDSQDRFNEIERVVKIFWSTRKFPAVGAQIKYPTKSQVLLSDSISLSSDPELRRKRARSRSALSAVSGSSGRSGSTLSYSYGTDKKPDKRKTLKRACKNYRGRVSRRKKHEADFSSDDAKS